MIVRIELETQPYRLTYQRGRLAIAACILSGLAGGCTESKPAKAPPTTAKTSGNKPSASEGPKSSESPPANNASQAEPASPAAPPANSPAADQPKPPPAAPAANGLGLVNPLDLILPPVLLTDQHAKTCLVKVGDQFPELTLPNLAGGAQPLKELFGEKATLIVFWKASNPYAIEELAHLQRSIVEQFAPQGARVIAIDVQDAPSAVQGVVERLQLKCPVMLDADGKAYAQLATGMFPRTYVIDESGKIVWFDIEYSLSTRRELLRALLTTLHKGH